MEQVHKEFNQKGLTVLAVNMQENRNRVANWVKKNNVTSLVLLDSNGAVTRLYRVTGTPTVVLVGRQGEMIGRAFGTRAMDGGERPGAFRGAAVSSSSRKCPCGQSADSERVGEAVWRIHPQSLEPSEPTMTRSWVSRGL